MATQTVSDWIALLDELYPPAHAQDWDAPGLQVGRPSSPVNRVLVTLDVTEAVILEAAAAGCDLIIAHHPTLFKPLSRLTPDTAPGCLALLAAELGIAIVAAHTNFDARLDTTSRKALDAIGATQISPLTPDDGDQALGLIGTLAQPTRLDTLLDQVRTHLPSPHARLACTTPETLVTKVACVGGAGSSLFPEAIEAGADVLITGDVSHHVALDALTLGLPLIDAGHYHTEHCAMAHVIEYLGALAAERGFDAELVMSTVVTDPWVHTV